VNVDGIGTTPLAGGLRIDRALSPATKQMLQAGVDHAYSQFLHRVADGRKKTVDDIDRIAQGRVWAGLDAQRIGLVDHLGGLKDATDAAAKLAELGADYDVDYIEPSFNLREELLMQLRGQVGALAVKLGIIAPPSRLQRVLDPYLEELSAVAKLNDPRGLDSYCWCKDPGVIGTARPRL
jgi:protease-4